MFPRKGYIKTMNNTGTKGTFTSPGLAKMGTMTGHLVDGFLGTVFMPDEKYHQKLINTYGYEPEEGLFLEGGTFTPAD